MVISEDTVYLVRLPKVEGRSPSTGLDSFGTFNHILSLKLKREIDQIDEKQQAGLCHTLL